MDKIIMSLKNYWFLVIALVTLSVAWGQSQVKLQTLEDAVKQNTTTITEVSNLKAQSERIEERTKSLLESQARQEKMIMMLIESQRNVYSKSAKKQVIE